MGKNLVMKETVSIADHLIELNIFSGTNNKSLRGVPTLGIVITKKGKGTTISAKMLCTFTTKREVLAFLNFLNKQYSFVDQAELIIDMKSIISIIIYPDDQQLKTDIEWYKAFLQFQVIKSKDLWSEMLKTGFVDFLANKNE